ncbi:MAG: bifunctional pyr operon transcriptional regulator/uracil phosphoribosyltransferase PyrR [Chloroflexota bacterium]|nr:bifunctional pyr operon transcriptional regulator/uracil phosphoribosyltransferase PyrR [Chloroflexota bacterium]
MDGEALSRTVVRLAHQVREQNPDLHSLVLFGIRTRGVPLAHRLSEALAATTGTLVPVHAIDITPYRDDLPGGRRSRLHVSLPPSADVTGLSVVLVDDVLYTGRTARAALDALLDIGRPSRVRLAVLVDRGHRELPIRADYVGKNLPSSHDEEVQVRLRETDGTDAVWLVKL